MPAAVWDYKLGGYQVLKKWLSYRERPVLGRPLLPAEVQHFMGTARRIAAILIVTAKESRRVSSSLSIDAETLLSLPIDEALAESDKQECRDYGRIFFDRARESEEANKTRTATAWRLLSTLVEVGLQASNLSEPFRPYLGMQGHRTSVSEDLNDATATAVYELAKQVSDPELRARLMDITWDARRDARRDHLAARGAIQCYLQSAARLMDPEDWPPYVERCERALRLAKQIRDDDLQDKVLSEIEGTILELDGTDPLHMTNQLMTLLIEFGRGNPETMSAVTEKAITFAEEENDFRKTRFHLENLVGWSRMARNAEAERSASIRIAASYERQAELCSDDGEFLLAARWMGHAHHFYGNITGMREKAIEVYRKLREFQRSGTGEMNKISTEPIDISEGVKQARERVSGLNFRKALLALAVVARPTDFNSVTQHARELMEEFPFQGLFGGVVMAHDGRVIAHRSPDSQEDADQHEQALWQRVVKVALLNEEIAVQVTIVPALNQIMFEHNPTFRDLRELVVHNPFIPEGHEELFAKGFLAGLRGNFPEALSILVPQLENSLRHLLEQSGLEISTQDGRGIQDVILLGSILGKEQLGEILSPDIVKELKVLFDDQQGPRLRHYIAHGLMHHDAFYGLLAIYAWWLIFYLCICPVQKRFKDEPESSEEVD